LPSQNTNQQLIFLLNYNMIKGFDDIPIPSLTYQDHLYFILFYLLSNGQILYHHLANLNHQIIYTQNLSILHHSITLMLYAIYQIAIGLYYGTLSLLLQ